MSRIKRVAWLGIWLLVAEAGRADAGLKEITDQPAPIVVLSGLLLLFMVAGFILCSRIRSFLRGGELVLGWFLILVSFLFLLGSQILESGMYFRFFDVSLTVVYFARLLWLMVLVLGIYFIQKIMS